MELFMRCVYALITGIDVLILSLCYSTGLVIASMIDVLKGRELDAEDSASEWFNKHFNK